MLKKNSGLSLDYAKFQVIALKIYIMILGELKIQEKSSISFFFSHILGPKKKNVLILNLKLRFFYVKICIRTIESDHEIANSMKSDRLVGSQKMENLSHDI